jgi:beta-N-acetylhexosaminidase
MTEHEKLCQLLIVRPEALVGVTPVTEAGEETETALADYPVGGFIYSTENLVSRNQTAAMINSAQSDSELGLLICADEEGGRVARLMVKLGTTRLESMYSYKDQGTDMAYGNAVTIGTDMRACGFNTDFAPVADVRSNPTNTVIGTGPTATISVRRRN